VLLDVASGQIHQLVGTSGFPVLQKAAQLLTETSQPFQNILQAVKMIQLLGNVNGIRKDLLIAVIPSFKK